MEFDVDDSELNELFEYQRKIRDPIYGYIELTEMECYIIDTPVFQRLDRIGQMHSVYKVYPSANYSRKVHSLGAMHLIGKAITRLLYFQDSRINNMFHSTIFADKQSRVGHHPDYLEKLDYLRGIFSEYEEFNSGFLGKFDRDDCLEEASYMKDKMVSAYAACVFEAVRVIGLLHDVGHGPFSHMLEHIEGVNFDHEDIAPQVIEILRSQAIEKLNDDGKGEQSEKWFNALIDFAKTVITSDGEDLDELEFLGHLVNFPFDCDMLDYVVRDSYFAGTPEYGRIDVDRIIKGFVVHEGNLKISKSEITAVSNAFESLFDMYKAVYSHKTVRMYDIILQRAFKNISVQIGRMTSNPEEFIKYDDREFISRIKGTQEKSYEECKEIYEIFENRKKPLEQIYHQPLVIDIPTLARELGGNPFDKAREQINEELYYKVKGVADEKGIQIEYDSVYNLRRAGISLENIITWVAEANLYNPDADSEDNAFISFQQYEPDIKERLIRAEVPVRIYVDRDADAEEKAIMREEIRELFLDFKKTHDFIE